MRGAFFGRETMTIVKSACLPTDFEAQLAEGSAAVTFLDRQAWFPWYDQTRFMYGAKERH